MTEPTVEALQETLQVALSMLQDLHEGFGWDELGYRFEEIVEDAADLGVAIERMD